MNNLKTYHGYILLTCDGSDINTILLILKHSISQRMEAEAIISCMAKGSYESTRLLFGNIPIASNLGKKWGKSVPIHLHCSSFSYIIKFQFQHNYASFCNQLHYSALSFIRNLSLSAHCWKTAIICGFLLFIIILEQISPWHHYVMIAKVAIKNPGFFWFRIIKATQIQSFPSWKVPDGDDGKTNHSDQCYCFHPIEFSFEKQI